MKYVRKLTPIYSYDIPGLESWLEEQAANDRQQGCEGELEGGQQIDVPLVGELVDRHDVQGVEQGAAQAEQVAPGDGERAAEGD